MWFFFSQTEIRMSQRGWSYIYITLLSVKSTINSLISSLKSKLWHRLFLSISEFNYCFITCWFIFCPSPARCLGNSEKIDTEDQNQDNNSYFIWIWSTNHFHRIKAPINMLWLVFQGKVLTLLRAGHYRSSAGCRLTQIKYVATTARLNFSSNFLLLGRFGWARSDLKFDSLGIVLKYFMIKFDLFSHWRGWRWQNGYAVGRMSKQNLFIVCL